MKGIRRTVRRALTLGVAGWLVAGAFLPATATAARTSWSVKGSASAQIPFDSSYLWRTTRVDVAPAGSTYDATGTVYVQVSGEGSWWTLVDVAYARRLDDGRVLVTGPTIAAGGTATGYTGWQYYHLVFDGKRAVVFSGGAEPGDGTTAANWVDTAYDPFYYPPYPYVGAGSWIIARGGLTLRE